MLFGDRIADDALRPHGDSRSLLDDGNACLTETCHVTAPNGAFCGSKMGPTVQN